MLNPPTSIIETWIRTHFEKCKKRKSELNAVCALCGDSKKKPGKKKRFFYNLQSHKWFCHNCNSRGTDFYSLVAKFDGITYGDAVHKFKQHLLQHIDKAWKKPKEEAIVEDEGEEFPIVDFLKEKCFKVGSIQNGMIKRALARRAIDEIKDHGVRVGDYPFYACFTGDYHGRLIVPFFDKGKVVYFQGRSIVKNLMPKYKNCPTPKSGYIFNEHNLHPDYPIYVFEGFWEAFILDTYLRLNATSILGKHIPGGFISRLLELTKSNVVLCYDNDKSGREKLLDLEGMDSRVKALSWPKEYEWKDLSEMWVDSGRDVWAVRSFLVNNAKNIWAVKVELGINNR